MSQWNQFGGQAQFQGIQYRLLAAAQQDKHGTIFQYFDPPRSGAVYDERAAAKAAVQQQLRKGASSVRELVANCAWPENSACKEDFTCAICLGLVYEPQQCSSCQNAMICKACVDQGHIRQCPLCKKVNTLTDPQKIVLKLLDDIEVVCLGPTGSGECSLKQKPIKYSVLVNQHAPMCCQTRVECPLGCGTIVTGEAMLDDHLQNHCAKGTVECACCEARVKREDIPSHSCEEYLYDQILEVDRELGGNELSGDDLVARNQAVSLENDALLREIRELDQQIQQDRAEIKQVDYQAMSVHNPLLQKMIEGGPRERLQYVLMQTPCPHSAGHYNLKPLETWARIGHISLETMLQKNEMAKENNFQVRGSDNPVRTQDYSYTGQVYDGKPQGIGRKIYPDNSIIEGVFKEGYEDGWCRHIKKDGQYFEGTFKWGKRHGNAREHYLRDDGKDGYFKRGLFVAGK